MTTLPVRPSHRGSLLVWSIAAALLLAPAVATQLTAEMQWSGSDFVVWGAMLAAAGGAYEFLARSSGGTRYRVAAALAVLAGFLLVWINLAVGFIGSENNDANLMYAGVLATAVGGSIVARGRARGMSLAMLATASAQVLVCAVALALDLGTDGAAWPRDVIGGTGIFTALWLASAWLFRQAG